MDVTMYRTIDAALWSDPKVHKLTVDAKLLFLYLITNPHAHISGFYYLPRPVILHETGLTESKLRYPIDTLSSMKLAMFDETNELVWVVNMLRYQATGPKANKCVEKQLLSIPRESPLLQQFTSYYPDFSHIDHKHKREYRIDTLSIPYRHQEQEQEQEQEQDKDSSEPPPAPSEPPYLLFPIVGNGRHEWALTESKVSEYQSTYPGVDVPAECCKARQWCVDNPAKRKTERGMTGFLNRWIEKAQNENRRTPLLLKPEFKDQEGEYPVL